MPKNKSHHYIPKFYLRFFSSHPEKKLIGLFNLNSGRFVANADIRHQSCRDYFYGEDGSLESTLASLESDSAKLLTWMIENDTHPLPKSKDHWLLLKFVFFLRTRTLGSAETFDDLLDRSTQKIYSRDPEFKKALSHVKIVHKNPAAAALWTTAFSMPLVTDLAYKMLVNETETPFITSDNPVAAYNQFFEGKQTLGSHTGFASMGLQVFLPLSPRHLVYLYDRDVYRVHGIFHRPVPLTNSEDIHSLNGLLYLSAESNLYFSNRTTESYITNLIEPLARYRRAKRSAVQEFVGEDEPDGTKTSLILSYPEDIHSNFSLSITKLTRSAQEFKLDNRTGYFRNERLVDLHDQFKEEVSQGRYQPTEFTRFLRDTNARRALEATQRTPANKRQTGARRS